MSAGRFSSGLRAAPLPLNPPARKTDEKLKKKGHTKSLGEKHPFVARFSLPYGHGHFSLTLFASRWTNKTKDGLPVVCAARGIKLFVSYGR